MTIEVVAGRQATIHFDAHKCIHARHCVLAHPDVFVPNVQGEWIRPDAQPVEVLMQLGKSCPSGAIGVVRNTPAQGLAPDSDTFPLVNTVRVRENGPLAFEAELRIGGVAQAAPRATLCRCGLSANKPFCDGSHGVTGFVATGEPATADFLALPVRSGPLDLVALPNGPLQISGPLEAVSGTGRTFNKVSETYLCRCGQSKNKPYCDGSHKPAGFEALMATTVAPRAPSSTTRAASCWPTPAPRSSMPPSTARPLSTAALKSSWQAVSACAASAASACSWRAA
ncbi:CDGSH iron-sulfur domain-containing protein [Massilia sp. DJPM01]|uniref:CDGSH iron-sulfur domain-containing protein n=1 Tax=Massilia sp. DJPM01 TaxID=3024404 RepID=UPI00259F49DA|nr:CDGSH iron-sulfur domain-containing protein [Massilia sp. DJPM01]MDM5179944.1 CDGSH iron-sulfur domain-containing protein [Massilia sp. DJPM01]